MTTFDIQPSRTTCMVGYGALGREIVSQLLAAGRAVTIIQRSPPMGLFVPFIREASEIRFLFDRPYIVDATKFRARFWSDVTPLQRGLAATALSFLVPTTPSPVAAPGPSN